jgi:hypothetical protein
MKRRSALNPLPMGPRNSTSFTLVQMRGIFKDIGVLRADQDIDEERTVMRIRMTGLSMLPRTDVLRLRLDRGEEIEVALPRRLRWRKKIDLYEITNCDGVRQRWARIAGT